jgi:hypothetical protein
VIRCLLVLAIAAACNDPQLSIRFVLTDGDSQRCISSNNGNETTKCEDITMLCKAVLSVRIVPPNEPEVPYVSVCAPLVGSQNQLCSIAGVDLPRPAVTVYDQVLEVQMAVFEAGSLPKDVDGNPICPIIKFAANGLPEEVACNESDTSLCPPRPAVGGRAFYYPGDDKTVVELGCTELALLTAAPECTGVSAIDVTAYVNDFDSYTGVAATTAEDLTVSLGEPRINAAGTGYQLTAANTRPLQLTPPAPPSWSANILDLELESTYCLEVFEDVAQSTSSLVCRAIAEEDVTRIDITGVRLLKGTLDDILLAATSKMLFPSKGLVVGLVLDSNGAPVTGARVEPSCMPNCTIQYLSLDRATLTMGPAASTSANGIWISQDAPFPATFNRVGQVQSALGGLVESKVTIVILQESAIGGG